MTAKEDIETLERLMSLDSETLNLQPVADGMATKLAARSASEVKDAVLSLQEAKLHPWMFIPVARDYVKTQRAMQQLDFEAASLAIDLKLKQDMADAQLAAYKAAAASVATSVPISIP